MEDKQLETRLATTDVMRNAPRGMTLIEILVVIAIIGIVVTVVSVGVVGYLEDAKIQSTKTLVNNVAKGASSYAVTNRRLPKTLDELVDRKYVKKNQLKDPWDTELEYNPGNSGQIDDFELCSAGPDGSLGTEDDICAGEEED